MVTARVQHGWLPKNGLAADVVINTFHFTSISPSAQLTVDAAEDLRDAVLNFYDANPPGLALSLASFMAADSFGNPRHSFRIYNMNDSEPRQPVLNATHVGIGTLPASTSLPAEVAVCLSYRAESASGQKPARRRGRLYLGPLNTTVLFEDPQGHSRPHQDIQNIATAAGKELQTAAQNAGYNWVVRHGGITTGDFDPVTTPATYAEITQVWVDNAFDTQRRRGPKPSGRTTVAV